MLACGHGNAAAAMSLLRAGADATVSDERGRTALYHTAYSGDLATIRLLLEHSNNRKVKLLRSRDNDGSSAVHYLRHSAECYTELLERGVDVNTADNNGMTPLAFYLSKSFYPSEIVVKLLLSRAASVGHTFSKNEMGLGYLYAAKCLKLNTGILKLLAEVGLDLKDTDVQGRTILHHAAITGSLTE